MEGDGLTNQVGYQLNKSRLIVGLSQRFSHHRTGSITTVNACICLTVFFGVPAITLLLLHTQ